MSTSPAACANPAVGSNCGIVGLLGVEPPPPPPVPGVLVFTIAATLARPPATATPAAIAARIGEVGSPGINYEV